MKKIILDHDPLAAERKTKREKEFFEMFNEMDRNGVLNQEKRSVLRGLQYDDDSKPPTGSPHRDLREAIESLLEDFRALKKADEKAHSLYTCPETRLYTLGNIDALGNAIERVESILKEAPNE